jgi:hypothetical protein
MAQRFDARRSELTSDAFPIAEGVGANFQNGWYSASTTGTLVYRTGQYARNLFTWFDRTGKNLGLAGEPGVYNVVSLSPDGTRAAIDRTDLLEGGGCKPRCLGIGPHSKYSYAPHVRCGKRRMASLVSGREAHSVFVES